MYIIVRNHWEGFEMIHPYDKAEDTREALIGIKLHVKAINEKADKINGDWDDCTDDELHSPWTKLLIEKKIEYPEYQFGVDIRWNDYCAQKWDLEKREFYCACSELDLNDKHRF